MSRVRQLWRGVLLFAGGVLSAAAAEPAPIEMAFYLPSIREANMADVRISLQSWADELGRPLGVKLRTSTYSDMATLRGAIDRAELDVVNASGMELAELFSPDELLGGYASYHHNVEEGLALVVGKASGLRSVADLRGKRIVRLSKDRLSEVFMENQCLKVFARECRDSLTMVEEKRDVQSVYNVFFGRTDAALVTLSTLRTAIDMNPQVDQRLTTILKWKTRSLTFAMTTRKADPAIRDIILKSAQEVMKTARGRQVLEMFRADEIKPADVDDLNPYWTLLRENDELRKTGMVKKK